MWDSYSSEDFSGLYFFIIVLLYIPISEGAKFPVFPTQL